MAVTKYLDKTGLSHFCSKIKAWCKATFALISHTHSVATASANGFLSSADKTKLNDLSQYPRFTYTAFNFIPNNSGTNYINQNSTESVLTHLSTTQESALRFKAYKGLSLTFEQPNIQSDAQYNDFHFVVDGARLVGDGLIGSAGTLSVPEYEGATASANATSGLVPPALKAERSYFLKGDGTWGDLSSKAEDSNVVHKTGNETISGTKTFTSKPVLNQVGLDMTVKDSTSDTLRTHQMLRANSSNTQYGLNLCVGGGGNTIVSGGEAGSSQLSDLEGNSGEDLYLVSDGNIYLKPNGNTWASAKTVTLDTSANLSGVGRLIYNTGLYHVHPTVVKGTNPSSMQYWTVTLSEKNGYNDANALGRFRTTLAADGTVSTYIAAFKNTADSTTNVSMGVKYDANGTSGYTFAPTPATADNSTKIATTAFVKAQGYLTSHQTLPTLSVTTSGDGNAVTSVTVSGHAITVNKNTTFLTAHQSLANYLTKLTNVSEMGKYIDMHYDNDTAAYNYDARIFVNTQGDGDGKGELKILASKVTSTTFNGDLTGNADTATKIQAVPNSGNTYVGGAKTGGALVNATNTGYGAIWNAPTKDYRVACSTYPSSTNNVYLCYSISNDNISSNTNTIAKSLIWNADTGILTANTFSGSLSGNATTVTGTAGSSALTWGNEITLYTVGGNAIKAKLPANPNTDTKVRQIVGSSNVEHPLLSRYNTEDATNTDNYTVYDTNVTVNPNKHTLTASGGLNTAGNVIINGNFVKQNTAITKGTNPSSTAYWAITFCDKDGSNYTNNCIGMFETSLSTAGLVKTYIRAMKNTAATATPCEIGVAYDTANSTGYTWAPTPATSDNSTKIATTAFVKAQGYLTSHQSLANYVTLDGTQTISGVKAITGGLLGINKNNSTDNANILYSTTVGTKLVYYTTTFDGTKLTNIPAALNTTLESRTLRRVSATDWTVEQICHNTNGLYYRLGTNSGWTTWKEFAFTDSNITGTSANVTGTVAIANGGTGATTRLNAIKALVNESVSTNATHFLGMKSDWSKVGYVSVADAKTVLGLGTAAYSDAGTFATSAHTHDYLPLAGGNLTGSIKLNSTNTLGIYKGNATSLTEVSGGSALTKGARLALYGESRTTDPGRFDLIAADTSASKTLKGLPSGTLTWNGQTVSTSSDERIKTFLTLVPENILDAWENVQWGEFKFLDAVSEKGESARLHTGLVAQAVDRVFKAKNLDACKYGILCHEEREATKDEPAIDLWMVRYTEALAMEAAYQRRKNKILENRISELENQLSSMLQTLKELKGVG